MTLINRIIQVWQRQARQNWVLLCGLAAVCACLWLFLETTGEAGEGEHSRLEQGVLRSFRHADDPGRLIGPHWVAEAARDFSALGGTSVTVFLTALVAGYLACHRRKRVAVFVIVTIAGGGLLGLGLKHAFGRCRPTVVPYLMEATDASFPSGHSMNSTVVYLTLGILLARSTGNRMTRGYFIGSALLLSGLVGLSRVMLGVHYPTDVAAGWAAGTGWTLTCWITADLLRRRTGATQ